MLKWISNLFNGKRAFINNTKSAKYYLNASVEIPESKDKIKIVPVGYFPNHQDGAHEVTKKNIDEMVKNIKNSGVDILFDYGHDIFWNPKAIAAGWSPRESAEAREDGLYIDYPTFTVNAQKMVDEKEYRYFSPIYYLAMQNKEGKQIGAVLHSVGLVNKPYMDKEINHIGNSEKINSQKINEDNMDTKLLNFLGLTESATEAEVEAKLNSLREKYGLQTDASVDDIFTAVEAKINSAATTTKSLEERVTAIENKDADNKVEALINSAISEGKIKPAEKQIYLNSAKNDFAGTKAVLDSIKVNSAMPKNITFGEASQSKTTKPPVYNRNELYNEIKNSTLTQKDRN